MASGPQGCAILHGAETVSLRMSLQAAQRMGLEQSAARRGNAEVGRNSVSEDQLKCVDASRHASYRRQPFSALF